jgi:hypothetical protein
MFRSWKSCVRFIAAIAITLGSGAGAMAEEDSPWLISKSSGEVWITAQGAQQASLAEQDKLKSGDTIRTGRNGRVLLTRGEETILVSPNSVIGIPAEQKQGLSTTILQQAGSILLEVEKRNVKHFEVETPYLAAVVKGTQFRVSVNAASTSVDVLRGQVEVADFKSGQTVQLLPGQVATAFARGKSGLALSGTGTFNPIEKGAPRAPSIQRIMVPKTGLPAPRNAGTGQQIRALGSLTHASVKLGADTRSAGAATAAHHGLRISSSLGEVHLNIHKVTNGLARAAVAPSTRSGRNEAVKDTIWGSSDAKASTAIATGSSQSNSTYSGNSSSSGSSGNSGNGGSSGNSAAGLTSTASGAVASGAVAAASVATTSSGSNGSGNGSTGNGRGNSGSNPGNHGNGNNGNGNSGNGNNGNGNGNGNGNSGNNGNGNGNNGNGNGHGKSKS